MEAGVSIAWLMAGTIAAIVSAFAAAASAIFSAVALRSQARAIDVSSYLEILGQLQQFERRLTESASVSEHWIFARREYVNFVEGLAHLYLKRRFGSGTTSLCRDALSSSIAVIEINSEMMAILEDSITSPETFEYLGKFRKKHRDIIESRKAIFRERAAKGPYHSPRLQELEHI